MLTPGEWVFFCTVPILTLLFIYAAMQTLITYRSFNFDLAVLVWCSLINIIAIGLEFSCSHNLKLSNQTLECSMIVYLLYRLSNLAPIEFKVLNIVVCALACGGMAVIQIFSFF
jgi:hypothetical protein